MKKRIVLIPLDERPCNCLFPQRLFSKDDVEIVCPKELGQKKKNADISKIQEFLLEECKCADGIVLSLDMLIYGGLVPSRLHNESKAILISRMEIIKEIKKINPKILIYAFECIMRCPDYSSSDEEPDYYEEYGKQIHDAGEMLHRSRRGENVSVTEIIDSIDSDALEDYVHRREINRYINIETILYLKEGYIDELVIPQDDSAPFGYAAMDQEIVRMKINEFDMAHKVLMYPGADEVGMTLISRMLCNFLDKKPRVYIKFASEKAKTQIPLYEGATLEATLKYHVLSAGCQIATNYENSDIILGVTAPGGKMQEAVTQPSIENAYVLERNIPEFLDFIKERHKDGLIVSIADNAYANGGDLELIHGMNQKKMLMSIQGYAGWNTSANTVGTSLAEGVNAFLFGESEQQKSFIVQRYIEDAGYCAKVRQDVTDNKLGAYGMNYFDVCEENGVVSEIVKEDLKEFIRTNLSSISDNIEITKVGMPWRRMFEIDLEAKYK